MEKEIADFKQRLSEECGDNDYNTYREQIIKGLDKYKK